MRITKQLAGNIAVALLSKKQELATKLKNEFKELAEAEYIKTLPKDVRAFSEKNSDYLQKVHDLKLFGAGFDHDIISLKKPVPTSNGSYGRTYLQCSDALAKRLLTKMQAADKAKKEYNEALRKVEATLLALGSYAKIRKEFPEAAPYLNEPEKVCVVLSNISEVRKLVK